MQRRSNGYGPLFLLVAFALTSCTSAGAPGALPASVVPQPAQHRHPGHGRLVLHIRVPKAHGHRGRHPRPRYISPSTQAITIAVTPQGGQPVNYNTDLTPASNPNCKVSLISAEICTVTLSLTQGSYTATFATYDELLDGNGNPQGHELSANQNVPLTITTGTSNAINVTLGGIPTEVAMLPDVTSTLQGNTTAGFTLAKCGSNETLQVLGLDADDNVILGPGAPVPSLVSDSSALTVKNPSASSPNAFTLERPSSPPNGGTIVHLKATVTPVDGTSASAVSTPKVPVTFSYHYCGIITQFSTAINDSGPEADHLATGPDGNMYFTEPNIDTIGEITTSGVVSQYTSGIPAGAHPEGIAAIGYLPQLVFTEAGRDKLSDFSTLGHTAAEFSPTLTTGAAQGEIVKGPDGNYWFTETGLTRIGKFSYGTRSVTEYNLGTGVAPIGIGGGAGGDVWVTATNSYGPEVFSFASGGYAYLDGVVVSSTPQDAAEGPDGNVWITEPSGGIIARVTPKGGVSEFGVSGAQPWGITSGPDGNLWFTDCSGHIGYITTAGVSTLIPYQYIVSPLISPKGIIVGPDGNLWFAEVGFIGRLQ